MPISVHYSDERWLDAFRYALGDDLTYKKHLYGYRLLVHYDAGCVQPVASYSLRELWTFFFGALSRSIKNHDIKFILVFFEKYKKGYDIIHSKAFRSLPRYDEYLE